MEELSPCIEWDGRHNKAGYGVLDIHRKVALAHRVAYVKAHGPIPDGLLVRHKCDNPPCVNPDHLIVGTHDDNMADMLSRERQARGEDKPNAVFTEGDVRQIALAAQSGETISSIAGRYSVPIPTVADIVYARCWRHVLDPMEYKPPVSRQRHLTQAEKKEILRLAADGLSSRAIGKASDGPTARSCGFCAAPGRVVRLPDLPA